MRSVWRDSVSLPHFEALEEDKKTDVLIIGGGIAGILCAYMLKNEGVDYILVEADTICSGTTCNTTAKITSQHGLIYSRLEKNFGLEYARGYLAANEQAIDRYRKICSGIDCDFEEKDNYVYTLCNAKGLENEQKTLERLGFKASYEKNLPLPIDTAGAIKFPNQAQFNPLKLISEIAKDLNIYEHTMVFEIENGRARTQNFTITADKIIVASHFPFINRYGLYFMKMFQHRSYVIALEHSVRVDGMYVDDDKKGYSFRQYGDLLLLGGAGHRTGKNEGGYDMLTSFKEHHYPHAKIKYRWAAQDCITLDGAAYIGQYSKSTPNLLVATGFNKWGMSTSMVAAEILTDTVLGRYNEFAEIFSPSRKLLCPQLAVNSFESIVNLLTPTTKRCSHLGCALKWNSAEHSWDCSCHGSRFEENGKLIDNPAMKDVNI